MTDDDEMESAEDTAMRHMLVADFVQSQAFIDAVSKFMEKGYPRESAEDMAIFEFEMEEGIL
jgi:hypothetical protein